MVIRAAASVLLLNACLCMRAELLPKARFAITNDQVAARVIAAFAQKGVSVERGQISLPTSVSSTEESPVLEVRGLGRLQESGSTVSTAVKLACSSPKVCLPFFAVVSLPNASDGSVLNVVQQPAAEVAIKQGAHITMLMVHGSTRLQMSVVSMESGALKKQIKVRSADRKQTFMATVIDANTVTGTF